ncbi:hypothetical protein FHS55_004405 [Angulomicrobium tetraedrale]|uniref:Uncharacterized protein n=1 Tax=Ancylobacter tetraedralis TaxID=217068 RepID=A0A839ZFW6_9HYPH|nr:hypothetical protein [Ancylobacter tetraedralis]MBB3773761.1 hypothetical protein [Ancylobacter tetraedralis]
MSGRGSMCCCGGLLGSGLMTPPGIIRPSPRTGDAEANFLGEARSNATHINNTYPNTELGRKDPGRGRDCAFSDHALMEEPVWPARGTCRTPDKGHADRIAVLAMTEACSNRPVAVTLEPDKS